MSMVVRLSNPLSADAASRAGITPVRAYDVNETVTVSDVVGADLIHNGLALLLDDTAVPVTGVYPSTTVLDVAGRVGHITAQQLADDVGPLLDISSSQTISATRVTAGRSLASGDAGKPVDFYSPTDVALTIPSGLPQMVTEVAQRGGGKVTVVAGSGVTLSYPADLAPRTRGQDSVLGLRRAVAPGTSLPSTPLLDVNPDTVSGSDGAAVAAVTNAGTLTGTISQATAGKRPTLRLAGPGGHKAIVFDGTSQCLALGGGLLDLGRNRGALTVYGVVQASATGAGVRDLLSLSVAGTGATNGRFFLQAAAGLFRVGGRRLDNEATNVSVTSTDAVPLSTWLVFTGQFVWVSAQAREYQNGTVVGSSTSWLTAGLTPDTASNTGSVGAKFDSAAEFWAGQLGRLLVYGAEHSASERAAVHSMLQATYGPRVSDYFGVADEWILSGDLDLA
jgi:hypothetical protein